MVRPWLALGLIGAAFVPVPAAASCAGPSIEVQPDVLEPGDQLHVAGEFFLDGCNDVGVGSSCNPIPQAPEPEPPMTGVRLELRGGGEVVDAAEVDADSSGRLGATLTLPADAKAGKCVVDSVYGGFRQQRVRVQVNGN